MIVQLITGSLPGNFSTFNYGNSVPLPEDEDKPWIRLNVDGTEDGIYVRFNGQWTRPHPLRPGMCVWVDTLPTFNTYDGGDANPLGYAAGPMWEEPTDVQGRVLVHGGQSNPAGGSHNFLVGEKAGEETHALTIPEMPYHNHPRNTFNDPEGVQTVAGTALGGLVSSIAQARLLSVTGFAGGDPTSTPANATLPHNNLQPYVVKYLIRRTARVAYAV